MYKHLLIAVEPAKSDKAICACQSARGEGDCDHRHRTLDRSGLCDTAYPSMISTYEKSAAGDAANILKRKAERRKRRHSSACARRNHQAGKRAKMRSYRCGIAWTLQPRAGPSWQHFP